MSPEKVKGQQLQSITVQVWAGDPDVGDLVREEAFLYDGSGLLVRKESTEQKDQRKSIMACSYDAYGYKVREQMNIPQEGVDFTAQKEVSYRENKVHQVKDLVTGLVETHTYDEDGRITEIESTFDDGTWVSTRQYTYNEAGNLLETYEKTPSWTLRKQREYNYQGQPTRETYEKDYEDIYEKDKQITITYRYNRHGRLIEKHMVNERNKKMRTLKYAYNVEGNLVRIKEGARMMHYTWDSLGRIIEARQQRGGTVLWTKQYEYTHGNQTKYTVAPSLSNIAEGAGS
ncbi:MAG: hypothetical protein AAFR59_09225 [Bacteroidota bacterium]